MWERGVDGSFLVPLEATDLPVTGFGDSPPGLAGCGEESPGHLLNQGYFLG